MADRKPSIHVDAEMIRASCEEPSQWLRRRQRETDREMRRLIPLLERALFGDKP
jgi:hypothetical protein